MVALNNGEVAIIGADLWLFFGKNVTEHRPWQLRKASQSSTNIIPKLMSLLCTVLPWVCPPLIFQVLTDYSLVLNPKYQLSYFHAKKWLEEWIDGALSVLRKHWVNNYKLSNTQEATTKSVCCIVWCNMNLTLCLQLYMITHLQHETTNNDLFTELDNFRASTIEDKLEEYLKALPLQQCWTPLLGGIWWVTTLLPGWGVTSCQLLVCAQT